MGEEGSTNKNPEEGQELSMNWRPGLSLGNYILANWQGLAFNRANLAPCRMAQVVQNALLAPLEELTGQRHWMLCWKLPQHRCSTTGTCGRVGEEGSHLSSIWTALRTGPCAATLMPHPQVAVNSEGAKPVPSLGQRPVCLVPSGVM